ncbi:MAG: 4a-hydroxytetrahydrobiopterin dehydratase [Candidatus Aenigmatarchaeota archaeon]
MVKKKIKGWKIINGKLERDFVFKDFVQALKFVNKVGKVAEKLNHHPDIIIHSWNKVKLINYTHSVKDLTEKDFILAEKINELWRKNQKLKSI